MDTDNIEIPVTASIGVQIVTTFALSLAATAGAFAGMGLIAVVYEKGSQIYDRRAAKKAAKNND